MRNVYRTWETPLIGKCAERWCMKFRCGGTDSKGSFGSSMCLEHLADVDVGKAEKELEKSNVKKQD